MQGSHFNKEDRSNDVALEIICVTERLTIALMSGWVMSANEMCRLAEFEFQDRRCVTYSVEHWHE